MYLVICKSHVGQRLCILVSLQAILEGIRCHCYCCHQVKVALALDKIFFKTFEKYCTVKIMILQFFFVFTCTCMYGWSINIGRIMHLLIKLAFDVWQEIFVTFKKEYFLCDNFIIPTNVVFFNQTPFVCLCRWIIKTAFSFKLNSNMAVKCVVSLQQPKFRAHFPPKKVWSIPCQSFVQHFCWEGTSFEKVSEHILWQHTPLRGSGDIPHPLTSPDNCLKVGCTEIDSAGFWQLADYHK